MELFFLQIQGSGQVQLENGERLRVGYADQNGHPYRSLGRHLVERGELLLEQASMQGIKAWAAANPAKLQEALSQNPSYVFFRELPTSDGPIGALSVPLHAERSLAVDRRFVPLGAPVYLATTYPLSEQPLERLMAAHDTGGAIRGVVRADFFWGTGPEAGAPGRAHAPAGQAVAAVAYRRAVAELVQQVLEVVGGEAAAQPLAVGEEQRRRAVDAEPVADLDQLVHRVGAARPRFRHLRALRRAASSSQALARSGEHHTAREWSAFCGRITGYMKT